MKVSAAYAREHFDDLLSAADNGEVVEVSREGKSSIKLIVMPALEQARPTRERILGAGRGELVVPTDEEWRQMKEEDARLMNDAPLMTTGEV